LPANLEDAVSVDFEQWITQQLAAGPRPRPGAPAPSPGSSRWRARVLQGAALAIALAVIGIGLGAGGALAPVQLEVGSAAAEGLPATTWAGSPPSPASGQLEVRPGAAPGRMQTSPRPSGGSADLPGVVGPMVGAQPSAPANPGGMGGPAPAGSTPSPTTMTSPTPGTRHPGG